MRHYSVIRVLLLVLLDQIFAEEQKFSGDCPDVKTQSDFDREKYKGLWYEIKKYPNSLVPEECGSALHEISADYGYNVTYLSKEIGTGNVKKRKMSIEKQLIKMPEPKYEVYNDCRKERIRYDVLKTDYETYSVVWGCVYEAASNTQRLFIYSKQKTLDSNSLAEVEKFLSNAGIDTSKLKDVQQDTEFCGTNLDPPEVPCTPF